MEAFRSEFRDALGDDLNTARALAALHTLLRQVNTALDGGGISAAVRDKLDAAFAMADNVLDIFPASASDAASDDKEIERLVAERSEARKTRDFARADEIRDCLAELGVVVEDTPHGAVWHRKN